MPEQTPDGIAAQIVQGYVQGKSTRSLAAEYGVCQQAARMCVRRAGVPLRQNKAIVHSSDTLAGRLADIIAAAMDRHSETIASVADSCDLSQAAVRAILRASGTAKISTYQRVIDALNIKLQIVDPDAETHVPGAGTFLA